MEHVESQDKVRGHWGSILAGTFAGFGTTILMTNLGAALGMSAGAAAASSNVDPSNAVPAIGVGAIVWTLLTAIVVGVVGGMVMSRLARHDATYRPALFGAVNWACGVALALIVVAAGGGGLMAGLGGVGASAVQQTSYRSGSSLDSTFSANRDSTDMNAQRNSNALANGTGTGTNSAMTDNELARKAAKAATVMSWTALCAQIISLLATMWAAGRPVHEKRPASNAARPINQPMGAT